VDRLEEAQERPVVLLRTAGVAAAAASVASGLAAGHTSVAGGLAAASGIAAGLAAAVTSVTGRLAAGSASVASGLTAAVVAAAAVLRLALCEQALQPAEKIVLLTARAIAAAGASSVTSRLTAGHTSITSGLAAAGCIAARLAAASTGVTRRLTTRIGTAVVSEHPVKELETIRLATNGRTECQYAEVQHTLHRATSPLLVDHARSCVPSREVVVTPRLDPRTLLRQACRADP
jgi:hypothetical protein